MFHSKKNWPKKADQQENVDSLKEMVFNYSYAYDTLINFLGREYPEYYYYKIPAKSGQC